MLILESIICYGNGDDIASQHCFYIVISFNLLTRLSMTPSETRCIRSVDRFVSSVKNSGAKKILDKINFFKITFHPR